MSLEAIKKKMGAIREEQQNTQLENDELKGRIKELENNLTKHERDIESAEHQKRLLAEANEKLEKDVAQHKATAEQSGDLLQQHDMLQSRYQSLEEESLASDKTIKDLKDQLGELSRTADSLQRENAVLKSQNQESEDKGDALNDKLKKVTKELEDFQLEIGNI